MARPNRAQIFKDVAAQVKGLNAEQIAEKLAQFSAEVGERPNAIQELTLEAFRQLLDQKEKKRQQEEKAAQDLRDKHQESLRQDEVLDGTTDNLQQAISFLQCIHFENDTWYLNTLTGKPTVTVSRNDLVEWASNVQLVLPSKVRNICPLGAQLSERQIAIIDSPQLTGTSLSHFAIHENSIRSELQWARRTPPWNAIAVLSRVAQSQKILASSARPNIAAAEQGDRQAQSQVRSFIDPIYQNGVQVVSGFLFEIGKEKLVTAIETIVKKLQEQETNDCWTDLKKIWPTVQRILDDAITMKPPLSIAEQVERMNSYISLLDGISTLPGKRSKPVTVLPQETIEEMAANMFEAVPRAIETSAVISQFPHYDRSALELRGMIFAREGKKTIFVAHRSIYPNLRSTDLRRSVCEDDKYLTKQRVAALDPAYDPKTYIDTDWVSGTLLPPNDLVIAKAKHNFTEGLDEARRKVGENAIPAQFSEDLDTARWLLGGKDLYTEDNTIQCMVQKPDADMETLEKHTTIGSNHRRLGMRDMPAHPIWRGIAMHNALASSDPQRNPRKYFDAGYTYLAMHFLIDSRLSALHMMKSTMQSTIPDIDPWLIKMTNIAQVMRMLNRRLTRIPPKSPHELCTRFELARYIWEILTRNVVPDPIVVAQKDAEFARDALYPQIPRPITPESDEPLGNLMKTLGIENNKTIGVRFLREGPNRMVFVSPKNSLPTYQLFHRTVEADEEVTLDRVVAADEALDTTIENEHGKWVSGTLPTVEELEKQYLHVVDVEEASATEDDVPKPDKKKKSSERKEEEHEDEAEQDHSIKVRCVRNALLRLSIQGKIGSTQEPACKPTYAFDTRKAEGDMFENGAGDKGKTVIIIPEAEVTFVISPNRKTRVIYNASMSSDAFSTKSIDAIDNEYGKHDVTFTHEEQFQRSIMRCIETRIDPKDRLTIYPVLSPKNPTPIQKFPVAESLQFLLSIFMVASNTSGKSLGALKMHDFQAILSGAEGVTWPLGGGHTSGLTVLRYVYQELKKLDVELPEEESIKDELYREAKAVYVFLREKLIAYQASEDPTVARIDSQRTESGQAANAATEEPQVLD